MKTETILNDLEKLFKAGNKEDALTILEAFQRDTLVEYRMWHIEQTQTPDQNTGICLHSHYIDKFIGETKQYEKN